MSSTALAVVDGFRCEECGRPFATQVSACFLCRSINSVHPAQLSPDELDRERGKTAPIAIGPPRAAAGPGGMMGGPREGPPSSYEDIETEEQDEEEGEYSEDDEPEIARLSDIEEEVWTPIASGLDAFDGATEGGLCLDWSYLLSGAPGMGKSTLTLQLIRGFCEQGPVFYAVGEESKSRIKTRIKRLKLETAKVRRNLHLASITTIEEFFAGVQKIRPIMAVLDSIHSVTSKYLDAEKGGEKMLKKISADLMNFKDGTECAYLVLCHARKDGKMAGPNTVIHDFDAHLEMRCPSENPDEDPRRELGMPKFRDHRLTTTHWLMTDRGLEAADGATVKGLKTSRKAKTSPTGKTAKKKKTPFFEEEGD